MEKYWSSVLSITEESYSRDGILRRLEIIGQFQLTELFYHHIWKAKINDY